MHCRAVPFIFAATFCETFLQTSVEDISDARRKEEEIKKNIIRDLARICHNCQYSFYMVADKWALKARQSMSHPLACNVDSITNNMDAAWKWVQQMGDYPDQKQTPPSAEKIVEHTISTYEARYACHAIKIVMHLN